MDRLSHAVLLTGSILASSVAYGLWPHSASAQAGLSYARTDSLAAAADRGDAEAQYEYGQLYEVGEDGMPVDYEIALEWYERAAEQDHIPAMLSLSTMLLGTEPAEAMRLMVKAAEFGSAEAQWRAGQVYAGRIFLPLAGLGLDREAALRWFTLGAEQGHHPSEEALADLYTDTEDAGRYDESIELYRRAADSGGSAWAVLRLGMIYAVGEGVAESDTTAWEWFSKLGSNYALDPDLFSNADLDVLGGLQAYYGLNFIGGDAEPDPAEAIESFDSAMRSIEEVLSRPFIHSSFLRTSRRMLQKLQN